MEELQPIGLVNEQQIKKFYVDKFRPKLISTSNYQIYISKKHGHGAGKYKISNINVNNQKITLSLDFKVSMFEAGSTVINQRVLFFKVEPNCEIVDIVISNESQK